MFGIYEEYAAATTPAHAVISRDRAIATRSFIGTDNHQATAEIRPGPFRNIKRHMLDLAHAIVASDEYVRQKVSPDYSLLAAPIVTEEPLGGHIHTSFWVKGELDAHLQAHQFMMMGGTLRNPNGGPTDRRPPAAINRQLIDAPMSVFDVWHYLYVMGYLLLPLEGWMQPWALRWMRNRRYGGADGQGEMYRNQGRTSDREGHAYYHLEYRVPSTWLVHPLLAYAYLACAKLSILNYNALVKEATNNYTTQVQYFPVPNEVFGSAKSRNNDMQVLFQHRLTSLMEFGVVPKDVKELPEVIEYCQANRDEWWLKQGLVNVEAWRRMIP